MFIGSTEAKHIKNKTFVRHLKEGTKCNNNKIDFVIILIEIRHITYIHSVNTQNLKTKIQIIYFT